MKWKALFKTIGFGALSGAVGAAAHAVGSDTSAAAGLVTAIMGVVGQWLKRPTAKHDED